MSSPGASNKEAGRTLGISPRTVEVHRARIMDKLGAKNAADLVRIVRGRRLAGAGKALRIAHDAAGFDGAARRGIDRADGVSPDSSEKSNGCARPRRWSIAAVGGLR